MSRFTYTRDGKLCHMKLDGDLGGYIFETNERGYREVVLHLLNDLVLTRGRRSMTTPEELVSYTDLPLTIVQPALDSLTECRTIFLHKIGERNFYSLSEEPDLSREAASLLQSRLHAALTAKNPAYTLSDLQQLTRTPVQYILDSLRSFQVYATTYQIRFRPLSLKQNYYGLFCIGKGAISYPKVQESIPEIKQSPEEIEIEPRIATLLGDEFTRFDVLARRISEQPTDSVLDAISNVLSRLMRAGQVQIDGRNAIGHYGFEEYLLCWDRTPSFRWRPPDVPVVFAETSNDGPQRLEMRWNALSALAPELLYVFGSVSAGGNIPARVLGSWQAKMGVNESQKERCPDVPLNAEFIPLDSVNITMVEDDVFLSPAALLDFFDRMFFWGNSDESFRKNVRSFLIEAGRGDELSSPNSLTR